MTDSDALARHEHQLAVQLRESLDRAARLSRRLGLEPAITDQLTDLRGVADRHTRHLADRVREAAS